jgi:uncharacterized protein GlcG (DUF336 family)
MALTLDRAQTIVDASLTKARQMGVKIAVVVVDSSGILAAAARMDGSGFLAPEIAQSKAYTAAAYRRDSGEMVERFGSRPLFAASMSALTDGRVLWGRGGFVLREGDQIVGAVGVSGGTEDEDCEVAQAGAGAFKSGA